jgi:23S rRNA pseudouridine1911/1915/1917 synthase
MAEQIQYDDSIQNSDCVAAASQEVLAGPSPPGSLDGYLIVRQYPITSEFDLSSPTLTGIDQHRLLLKPGNVTVPVALMTLDPSEYPTLSRARKAVRKKHILLQHAAGLGTNEGTKVAKVDDRVGVGDVLTIQERKSEGDYSLSMCQAGPKFDLPIIYEDDHFAIVNKPAGTAVYGEDRKVEGGQIRKGKTVVGPDYNTILYALPYVLQMPKNQDAASILLRPQPCHRLDRPTSGLLVVGKTKEAVIELSRQFQDRVVQKTYTAIVNGRLVEDEGNSISSKQAHDLGIDVDPNSDARWQMLDDFQEEKSALTIWRVVRHCQSMKSKDTCVTLVELKPKTGRKHQLRRHMAWVCNCPIVGDSVYGTLYDDEKRWGRGLMLCSNKIRLHHPYYNTQAGRAEWNALEKETTTGGGILHESNDGMVVVTASIDLPYKFEKFMQVEETIAKHCTK